MSRFDIELLATPSQREPTDELIMSENSEKIPDPKELEKELGDFLAKKFGGSVKLATPIVMPQAAKNDEGEARPKARTTINFDLKPQDLVAYLDQYIVKQTAAKDTLATKICTHFNRIKHLQAPQTTLSTWSASSKTMC
jgi:ATP-dependent Clp protease ATP-binding subunit ClpX